MLIKMECVEMKMWQEYLLRSNIKERIEIINDCAIKISPSDPNALKKEYDVAHFLIEKEDGEYFLHWVKSDDSIFSIWTLNNIGDLFKIYQLEKI